MKTAQLGYNCLMTSELGPQVSIRKSTGEYEPFEPEKLLASLSRAGASESVRNQIASHIAAELREGMSTSQIYKHAFFLLKKNEKRAAVRYSLRRAIMDLGPSGFPFEKFVGEIFREKGYDVKTDIVVRGKCIEHEVDVAAWNENELILIEAKFHNGVGIKSDAKVALYVKSRFDDLRGQKFDFGGEREMSEGWLVTNTKFSHSAILYGKCQDMKMVGWNYPAQGNLQDLIEDSGLHPLTSLTSLSNKEKADLMTKGVVLARALVADPGYLEEMGMSPSKMKKVKEEVSLLAG